MTAKVPRRRPPGSPRVPPACCVPPSPILPPLPTVLPLPEAFWDRRGAGGRGEGPAEDLGTPPELRSAQADRAGHPWVSSGEHTELFGFPVFVFPQDFLSAVEDAENQFVIPGHSAPSGVLVPPSKAHPSKAHPSKAPTLRPLAGQGEHPVGFQGPPSGGAAPQDELDNDLFLAACRELEGPEVPAGAGTAPLPPGHHEKPPWKCPGKENTQECGIPKKLRVGEELVPGSGGMQDRQGPLPSPKLVLRPSAAGVCTPRPPPSVGKLGSSGGSIPAPGAPSLRPVRASLGGSSSSVPWTPPAQSCPQPRLPLGPPSGPPGFPNPPAAPNAPGPPNPPVVTNHLVQLVTAASKAPGGPSRAPPRRESRRFPGPAGILPQQVGNGNGGGSGDGDGVEMRVGLDGDGDSMGMGIRMGQG